MAKPKPKPVAEDIVTPTPPELLVVESVVVVAGVDEPVALPPGDAPAEPSVMEEPPVADEPAAVELMPTLVDDEPVVAEETAGPEAPVEDAPVVLSPVEMAEAQLRAQGPGKRVVRGGEKMAAALRARGWKVARVVPSLAHPDQWDVVAWVP